MQEHAREPVLEAAAAPLEEGGAGEGERGFRGEAGEVREEVGLGRRGGLVRET